MRSASSRLFGSSSTTRILAITSLRSGLVRGEWQLQREGGTEPQSDAARGHRSVLRFDDQPRDVETEADADLVLGARRLDPSVLPEDHSEVRARQPDALILHNDARSVLALAHGHVNRRARWREAKRVVEDVLDRGTQTFRIGVNPDRVGLRDELEALAIGVLDERRHEFG